MRFTFISSPRCTFRYPSQSDVSLLTGRWVRYVQPHAIWGIPPRFRSHHRLNVRVADTYRSQGNFFFLSKQRSGNYWKGERIRNYLRGLLAKVYDMEFSRCVCEKNSRYFGKILEYQSIMAKKFRQSPVILTNIFVRREETRCYPRTLERGFTAGPLSPVLLSFANNWTRKNQNGRFLAIAISAKGICTRAWFLVVMDFENTMCSPCTIRTANSRVRTANPSCSPLKTSMVYFVFLNTIGMGISPFLAFSPLFPDSI
jgi:hypothetical protein